MDVDAYLERIGYRGPLAPTAETLRRLHVAHLLAVPFENLSIHAGETVVLDDESLFDKVVARGRGGFCYELNGLFAALLRGLGFRVEMLSAEVAKRGGGFGPEFDHMALLVTLEERWLADVGFGDSFVEPLLLDERAEQAQGARAFRIEEDGGGRLVLSMKDAGGGWEPQYRFGLEPHAFEDYAGMCRFHQTSPESHFTRGRVCSRLTPEGRVTLSGSRLITTRGGERVERELQGEAEYAAALLEHFGISMPGPGTNP
ncbi:MAG TPA: arylamine N-acetyltransferase [Pyrinomonadaceae bacterium]|jgi:N-hydroxyarylamine O-acetyltransferase